jgi:hypothetical protein
MTANQLRRQLDGAGINHSQAARMLGLTYRTLSRYCNGHHVIPRVVELAVKYIIEHPDTEDAK